MEAIASCMQKWRVKQTSGSAIQIKTGRIITKLVGLYYVNVSNEMIDM